MPKAEGYGALCTSIASLYEQQRTTASSFVALQQEGDKTRASHTALQQRVAYLEQQNAALERKNKQLELAKTLEHKISVERQSQATAEIREGIADRDLEWQHIVHNLKADKAALKQQLSLLQQEVQELSTSAVAE